MHSQIKFTKSWFFKYIFAQFLIYLFSIVWSVWVVYGSLTFLTNTWISPQIQSLTILQKYLSQRISDGRTYKVKTKIFWHKPFKVKSYMYCRIFCVAGLCVLACVYWPVCTGLCVLACGIIKGFNVLFYSTFHCLLRHMSCLVWQAYKSWTFPRPHFL